MGVQHLLELGHHRIAIVTGPLGLKNEKERLEGYRRALARAGIEIDVRLIWEGNLRPENVAAICRQRLRNPDTNPSAIFCTNGPTGLGVLQGLRELRLKTPDHVAFVCFDELTVADLFSPSITTVVQPSFEIGARAAEILLLRINGAVDSPDPISIRLPATLKIGESSQLVTRAQAAARA
jgi:DNA-binding LacI/PurR family transcriptional regulator